MKWRLKVNMKRRNGLEKKQNGLSYHTANPQEQTLVKNSSQ